MTAELTANNNPELPIPNREDFIATANTFLMPLERQALFDYIQNGGKPIPPTVSQAFFELFYNGCAPEDIHELNPSFDIQAIQWARVMYHWDDTVSQTVIRNNQLLVGKIHKAQTDAAMLMTDMIAVATKKNLSKLRKYLQTGDEKCLEGTFVPDNQEKFFRTVESLVKLVYREEQTLSIKIPVGKVPAAVSQKAREITATATSLVSDIAKQKRENARAKVLEQIKENDNGQDEVE